MSHTVQWSGQVARDISPPRVLLYQQKAKQLIQDKEYSAAIFFLLFPAKQGQPVALTNLGSLLLRCSSSRKMQRLGVRCLTKAARLGSPVALYNLSYCARLGLGLERSAHKALSLMVQAAKQHYAPAQYWLGRHILMQDQAQEQGGQHCQGRARLVGELWLKRAADQGYLLAQLALASRWLQQDDLEYRIKAWVYLTLAKKNVCQLPQLQAQAHIDRLEAAQPIDASTRYWVDERLHHWVKLLPGGWGYCQS